MLFVLCAVILAFVMLCAMATATEGYHGDGARYGRYVMKASTAIKKGESVALDGTPELIVSTTSTHELNVGIALESKTSLASGSMYITVCKRGIVEITAEGDINGGDRVRNSTTTAGAVMARTLPTSAGANPTQAEFNAAWQDQFADLGFAPADIADTTVGDIFVDK